VRDPSPTLVLLLGPFDPSGSGDLPADAVTCAALGGHALSVATSIHVQDTASIEDIHELSPDLIDDQARCLLEDMNVRAIKAGPIYNTDCARVLAQIAADYSQLPLVLHFGTPPEHDVLAGNDEPEDVLSAIFELLLPQTDLVLIEHGLMARWHADGMLPDDASGLSPGQVLLQYGAQWVLTTGAPMRPGQGAYLLQGPENATFNWAWQAPPARLADVDGPLACAATIQLAQGLPMQQAVENALRQAGPLAAPSFQPGMGHRLINRSPS